MLDGGFLAGAWGGGGVGVGGFWALEGPGAALGAVFGAATGWLRWGGVGVAAGALALLRRAITCLAAYFAACTCLPFSWASTNWT